MTKTEAAQTIATAARVKARRSEREVTLWMCEELISEYRHPNYAGSEMAAAAKIANPKTAHRLATRYSL